MTHFSIAEWTDYVRGLTEGAAARRMRAHVDGGCRQCDATMGTLKKLVAVIAAEASPDVPRAIIHKAKSVFASS